VQFVLQGGQGATAITKKLADKVKSFMLREVNRVFRAELNSANIPVKSCSTRRLIQMGLNSCKAISYSQIICVLGQVQAGIMRDV